MANELPDLLSAAEAARLLRRHPRTLRNWRDEGRGPLAIRLGYKWAYPRVEIDAYLSDLMTQAREHRQPKIEECVS